MEKSLKTRISGAEISFKICPGAPQTRSEVLGMRFSMSLEIFMDYIIQFFLQTRGIGSEISNKVGSES